MPVCAAPRGGMQAEQATIRHCQHLGDFAAARFLMKHFFEELKERKVFRVGLAYAVVAWLLIQVVATVEGALNLPAWSDTLVIILLAIGFPIAVILAWAYDVTPQGIRRAAADGAGDARQPDPDSDPPAETSIAVLPFVNMSSDPEQEYFSDGISEELLNQLVTLKGVHVAGRTSSFSFKGKNEDLRIIGEKLRVAHILEGSVRKAGNRVRITAQLIKVSDGYHLWSKTFDRDLNDIFAIQDETAKAVADALSVILGVSDSLSSGGTTNVEAYDSYLAGLAKCKEFSRQSYEDARRFFETAVALDPGFADAWAWLAEIYDAEAHTFMAESGDSLAVRSSEAAARAIEIAPESPAALRVAALLAIRNRDWMGAERYLLKALQIVPGDATTNYEYGRLLMYLGRTADSLRYIRRAAGIDPLSIVFNLNVGVALQMTGEHDAAMRQYERTEDLPGNKDFLHTLALVCAMESGDRKLVERRLEKVLSRNPDHQHPSEAITYAMGPLLDDPARALTELRRLEADPAHDNPLGRAIITVWAAWLGDDELALKQFQKLIDSRVAAFFIIWRPIQHGMRMLPGFKDFLRQLGLVDYWRTTGNWSDFCRPVGEADFKVIQ
jgi:adenylate cyclase